MPATITSDKADPARPRDIRAFTADVHGTHVLYRHIDRRSGRPAFTDLGRRILLHHIDRDSVLAALQLASQKWGEFRVSGSETYRKMCVALAAEHDLRLVNAELQEAVLSARMVRREAQRSPRNLPPPSTPREA